MEIVDWEGEGVVGRRRDCVVEIVVEREEELRTADQGRKSEGETGKMEKKKEKKNIRESQVLKGILQDLIKALGEEEKGAIQIAGEVGYEQKSIFLTRSN